MRSRSFQSSSPKFRLSLPRSSPKLILGAIALVLAGGGILKFLSFFTITTTICSYEQSSCPEMIEQKVQSFQGAYIFSPLHASAVLPGYRYTLKRSFPHTVSVDVFAPIPVAVISTDEAQVTSFVITEEGILLPTEKTDDILPPIWDTRIGDKKDGDILDRQIVSFYKELKEAWTTVLKNEVDSIRVESANEIRFHTQDATQYILSQDGLSSQLVSLQQLFNSTTIEGTGNVIDLRFDHPVMTKEN